MNTLRIYGKAKEISDGYFEVTYKEYRTDGTLKQTGTEDFTTARLLKQTSIYSIHTWDGNRRNKGGYKWFDNCGMVRVTSRDGLKEYAAALYPDAKEIQIRKCL